jgi:hypothetical protein
MHKRANCSIIKISHLRWKPETYGTQITNLLYRLLGLLYGGTHLAIQTGGDFLWPTLKRNGCKDNGGFKRQIAASNLFHRNLSFESLIDEAHRQTGLSLFTFRRLCLLPCMQRANLCFETAYCNGKQLAVYNQSTGPIGNNGAYYKQLCTASP